MPRSPELPEKPPLRIGLLLDPHRRLQDWETRILLFLFSDPRYDVVCACFDGRPKEKRTGTFSKFRRAFAKKRLIKALLLGLLGKLEDKYCIGTSSLRPTPEDRKFVDEHLDRLDKFPLSPDRRGWLDVFGQADHDLISNFRLDLLLRHDFNIIRGPILTAPRYGIWSFHHADNRINRGLPSGFWEVYQRDPVTGVTLQVLVDELDGGRVIDRGFYSTQSYWHRNSDLIREKSVEILEKNLRLLHQTGTLQTSSSGIYSERLYREPSSWRLLHYMSRHAGEQLSYIHREIAKRLRLTDRHGGGYGVWKLHIGKGSFMNSVLWRTKTIEPPKNEFWADPFLWCHQNKNYVFFENYEYSRSKGKISCGILNENGIDHVVDALDLDYHLSYPFLFESNDEIYMIPETHQARRIEIWKCDTFPQNWTLHRVLMDGCNCADAMIVKDLEGLEWLFVNVSRDRFNDHHSHLYLYRIEDIETFELTPHNRNPVVTDSRSARNGGNVFIDASGRLLRPAQCNQNGIYGENLVICWIKKLNLDEYEQEVIATIKPNFKDRMFATHHLTQLGNHFVIDGCYRKR